MVVSSPMFHLIKKKEKPIFAEKFNYSNNKVIDNDEVEKKDYDTIIEVARIFADKVKEDKIIHFFGTGHSHMIGIIIRRKFR